MPPHLRHPSEPFVVWFTEPLGMLTQITHPAPGSAEIARFITELAWPALLELRGGSDQPLFIVHDLSMLEDVEPEAARIMTMFGLSIRKDTERVVIIEPPTLPRFVSLAINAVGTALGLIGIPVELVPTVEDALARHNLKALER